MFAIGFVLFVLGLIGCHVWEPRGYWSWHDLKGLGPIFAGMLLMLVSAVELMWRWLP